MEAFIDKTIKKIKKCNNIERKTKYIDKFIDEFRDKTGKSFDSSSKEDECEYNNEYLFKKYKCEIVFFNGDYQFLEIV